MHSVHVNSAVKWIWRSIKVCHSRHITGVRKWVIFLKKYLSFFVGANKTVCNIRARMFSRCLYSGVPLYFHVRLFFCLQPPAITNWVRYSPNFFCLDLRGTMRFLIFFPKLFNKFPHVLDDLSKSTRKIKHTKKKYSRDLSQLKKNGGWPKMHLCLIQTQPCFIGNPRIWLVPPLFST